MTLLLLVSVTGGLGAVARFALDSWTRRHLGPDYPFGTFLVNASGALLLGLVTGLALAQLVSEVWQTVLGVGLMGGYTTFSTASVETVRLLRERRWAAATVHGVGMLVLSVLLAGAGLWLGLAVG
jgi:CrcB protein